MKFKTFIKIIGLSFESIIGWQKRPKRMADTSTVETETHSTETEITIEPKLELEEKSKPVATQASLEINRLIEKNKVVDWTENDDIKNSMRNDIDDYLYNIRTENGLDLDFDLMDRIIEETIDIARKREV